MPSEQKDWLKARKGGIGASEAAAVLGWSRFQSPFSLWARKTGKIDDLPGIDPPIVEWGHRHEPAMAKKFQELIDAKQVPGAECLTIHDPGDHAIERSNNPDTPWALCSLDRELYRRGERVAVLEMKTAYFDSAKEWTERLPVAFQIQLQYQLYVTVLDHGYFAALLNGFDFRWYRMDRNERFIQRMIEKCKHFWEEYVVKDVPPPADENPATADAIARVYPAATARTADLSGEELYQAHEARERLTADLKRLEAEHDGATNRLKAAIGDAEYGVLPDGSGYSYKNTKKGRTFKRVKKCPQPQTVS